jgi:hypothetical protein
VAGVERKEMAECLRSSGGEEEFKLTPYQPPPPTPSKRENIKRAPVEFHVTARFARQDEDEIMLHVVKRLFYIKNAS